MTMYNRNRHASWAPTSAPVLIVLLLISGCAMCLEQDAQIITPIADLAKSIISAVTEGNGLQFDSSFNPVDYAKSYALFTWRTGFPITMPKSAWPNTLEFYGRVKQRVDEVEIKGVTRKTFLQLKVDLDNIVDSIVEEVRQSPDGLYTDYTNTKVGDQSLEDASVAVGIQLKAYGIDLTNYRNIAAAVLGIPFLPTVASTAIDLAKMAHLPEMADMTSNMIAPVRDLAPFRAVSQLSGSALNTMDTIYSRVPMVSSLAGKVFYPQSLFQEPLMIQQA